MAFFLRQPIFDAQAKVWGYELIFSDGPVQSLDRWLEAGVPASGADGLPQALESLAGGKRLWLNCSPDFLLSPELRRLPPGRVVLEVPAEAEYRLREAGRHLKELGFVLALRLAVGAGIDGSSEGPVSILRVDLPEPCQTAGEVPAPPPGPNGLKHLAGNLKTWKAFREATQAGFSYGEGPFYSRFEAASQPGPRRYKLNYVKLLNELGQATLDFPRFGRLIEGNPPLVHKLLNYLNSAFFGLPCRVSSVHQALLLLGEQELRKWAALAIIHHLGEDQPEELLRLSLLRARWGEILAGRAGLGQGSELFLAGLLSLLDVYLGRPLIEILADLPLSPLIRETLQEGASPHRQVFDLVLAQEQADWERASRLAAGLKLSEPLVAAAYLEAVDGVEQAVRCWGG